MILQPSLVVALRGETPEVLHVGLDSTVAEAAFAAARLDPAWTTVGLFQNVVPRLSAHPASDRASLKAEQTAAAQRAQAEQAAQRAQVLAKLDAAKAALAEAEQDAASAGITQEPAAKKPPKK